MLGLRYPTDFRERRGPIFIVKGEAAFEALDGQGHMAIGLPDRDEPCLKKVGLLLAEEGRSAAPRDLIVLGSRLPAFDHEVVACRLNEILGVEVNVARVPEPFDDVAGWVAHGHTVTCVA